MKAAIAIALSHHADLIIMDEPTSGLDPVFRRELLDLFINCCKMRKSRYYFRPTSLPIWKGSLIISHSSITAK